MSLPKRQHRRNLNEPKHAHELTFSCYQQFQFLHADRTREWLVTSINDARQEYDFALWAYVFMPEHVHLILFPRPKVYDIADIRKAIKAPVASQAIDWLEVNAPDWIPKITRRRGKKTERLFWQSGGGYDWNITCGKTLLGMIDSVHLNPVRRGLVERAGDWKWSSARWYDEGRERPLEADHIPPD